MDYNQLSRSALIRLLQEYDAANRDAGKDGTWPAVMKNRIGRPSASVMA